MINRSIKTFIKSYYDHNVFDSSNYAFVDVEVTDEIGYENRRHDLIERTECIGVILNCDNHDYYKVRYTIVNNTTTNRIKIEF